MLMSGVKHGTTIAYAMQRSFVKIRPEWGQDEVHMNAQLKMLNYKVFLLAGTFLVGTPLMASIPQPQKVSPSISEIKSEKLVAPEYENSFEQLNHNERQYAESWEQQQKLRGAVLRVSNEGYSRKKVKAAINTSPTRRTQRR